MIAIFFRNLFRDLIRQPLRTALTLSGVVWGTFSVVVLLAFGDSVSKAQVKRFHGMGSGIVLVFPSRTTLPWQGFVRGKAVRVTPETAEAIPEKVPGIEVLSPEFVGSRLIRYGRKEFRNTVRGVNPSFELMRNTIAAKGRFIDPEDMADRKRVCFIGDILATDLFATEEPVGQAVFIDSVPVHRHRRDAQEAPELELQRPARRALRLHPLDDLRLALRPEVRLQHHLPAARPEPE